MDVTGQLFTIQKNWRKKSRRFYTHAELDEARARAREYANKDGEDFLIVQVRVEIPSIEIPRSDEILGKYFLIQKHQRLKKGRIAQRRFFSPDDLEAAIAAARRLMMKKSLDYLVVQAVDEVSAPQLISGS